MRRLRQIVGEPVGVFFAMALPQPLPDGDAGIAAGQEAALVAHAAAFEGEAQDDGRVVLLQLFFVFLILGGQRPKQPGLERAVFDAVTGRESLVELNDDIEDVVGLAVHVFAHDEDAIAVCGVEAILAEPGDAPARLFRPRLGVLAQRVVRAQRAGRRSAKTTFRG